MPSQSSLQNWEDADLFDGLRNKINNDTAFLKSTGFVPVGSILMWSGNPNDTSLFDSSGVGVADSEMEKFALCLGQPVASSLLKSFDGSDQNITPDLRSRFIVGWDSSDPDYAEIAAEGGLKKVTLTAAESGLREHSHNYTNPTLGSGGAITGSGVWLSGNSQTSGNISVDTMSGRNGAQDALNAHENRPPFYTLAYIIRYK